MSDQRRKALLAILGVLALILVWRSLPGGDDSSAAPSGGKTAVLGGEFDIPAQQRAPRGRRGRNSKPAVSVRDLPVEQLDLAALEPRTGSYTIGRDPWDFYRPPPPPPPPRVTPPVQTRPVAPPPPAQRTSTGPALPRVDVKYLGWFGPRKSPIAVFSDGKEIYLAAVGERVKDQFEVAEIGLESVYLKYVAFPKAEPKQLSVGR